MAKVKSSHPVTTCIFKSMLSDAAIRLTVKPFEGFDKDVGLASGKWVKMGVPWVYFFPAG